MNTKLITALRVTASAIEAGTFNYDWRQLNRCNCGSLFCALTGKSASELKGPPPIDSKHTGTWTELVGMHCPITGLPTQVLFKELFNHGLTQQDIINLECLKDDKVIARMRLNPAFADQPAKRKWYQFKASPPASPQIFYKNKNHVAAYMRAWADLLTEEGRQDVANNNTESHEAVTN